MLFLSSTVSSVGSRTPLVVTRGVLGLNRIRDRYQLPVKLPHFWFSFAQIQTDELNVEYYIVS